MATKTQRKRKQQRRQWHQEHVATTTVNVPFKMTKLVTMDENPCLDIPTDGRGGIVIGQALHDAAQGELVDIALTDEGLKALVSPAQQEEIDAIEATRKMNPTSAAEVARKKKEVMDRNYGDLTKFLGPNERQEHAAPVVQLEDMNRDDVRSVAKGLGIKNVSKFTKTDLIAEIRKVQS